MLCAIEFRNLKCVSRLACLKLTDWSMPAAWLCWYRHAVPALGVFPWFSRCKCFSSWTFVVLGVFLSGCSTYFVHINPSCKHLDHCVGESGVVCDVCVWTEGETSRCTMLSTRDATSDKCSATSEYYDREAALVHFSWTTIWATVSWWPAINYSPED